MKRAELFFNLLAIPIDAAMVVTSAVFAYILRVKFAYVWPILFEIDPIDYLETILFILPFFLALLAAYGLYNVRSTDKLGSELAKILAAVVTALMVVVLIFFFNRDVFPSRLIVLLSGGILLVMLSVGRIVLRLVRDGQLRRGYGAHRLVISVGPKTDPKIIENLKSHPEYGYKIIGQVESNAADLLVQLEQIHQEKGLDEFLQTDPDLTSARSAELVGFCHDRGIKYNFVPNIFEVSTRRMEMEMFGEAPVIKLKGTPLDGWGRVVKRSADVVFSGLAMLLLSPVFLAVFMAIKLDSRGPALYVEARAGYGREFVFYKFRSMYAHLSEGENYGGERAEKMLQELVTNAGLRAGPIFKIKDDPRVTRVGRFIRKTKLDELPQFWNVLKGDMSLVGPRAHQVKQVRHYGETHKRLFTIKPGLTGLTQITQIQNPSLPFDEEVRLDTYYIENWSLRLDIKIIARTAWALLRSGFSRADY